MSPRDYHPDRAATPAERKRRFDAKRRAEAFSLKRIGDAPLTRRQKLAAAARCSAQSNSAIRGERGDVSPSSTSARTSIWGVNSTATALRSSRPITLDPHRAPHLCGLHKALIQRRQVQERADRAGRPDAADPRDPGARAPGARRARPRGDRVGEGNGDEALERFRNAVSQWGFGLCTTTSN